MSATQFLKSFFNLGFEFEEIFLIENQFSAIAEVRSHQACLKEPLFSKVNKNFGITTLHIGDMGSRRLSASYIQGVGDSPYSAKAGSRFSITKITAEFEAKIENVSSIM
jgi:hypothetical protein